MVRTKSRQNQVPREFANFYKPLLLLKQILQSKVTHIDEKHNYDVISGLMVVHYSTFFMRIKCKENNDYAQRCFQVRTIIEGILEGDLYELQESEASTIISFIDLIAKIINTTPMINLYIILYNGYLDYQIYANFNKDKPLFDYKYLCNMSDEIVSRMREYSLLAQVIIDKQQS